MHLPRNRHLPPSEPYTFSNPVPAGQSATAFEGRREQWNGVIVYGRSDQNLLVHVDSGTEFGGSIVYVDRRTNTLPAGTEGRRIPIESAAEWIRVVLENPGNDDAETVRVASYLSTVGMIPNLQKPLSQVWNNFLVPNRPVSGTLVYYYSSPVDLTGALGARAYGTITNGPTGPSQVAAIWSQISPDGVTWIDYKSLLSGTTTASAVGSSSDSLDGTMRYARLRATAPFGQPVTISGWISAILY